MEPTPPPRNDQDRARDLVLVKFTCTVTWPGGAEVIASLSSEQAGETVPVNWFGMVDKIEAPLRRACSYILEADLRDQAEKTGGTFNVKQDGLWPAMDGVTA
jgi:hypothetical protein